ncbi:segregation and condensation protein B [Parelusimicrobium proximum]|uniref:SMC-Scp complex subunit ScpB n=1 Tax=Parelusimicrobium proximum TaxID=3228953 RepID=UPI003D16D2E5
METNTEAQNLEAMENDDLLKSDDAKKIIENLLFITDRPITPKRICEVVDTLKEDEALELIFLLQREYNETKRAIAITEVGGGWQMSTKPEYGTWVRRLYNENKTARLSNAALETLAIIAYKQPITRTEVEQIRGVDISAPLDKLLDRGLVKAVGKKEAVGRPMMYGTTEEFLRMFGFNSISELPDVEKFASKKIEEAVLPFDAEGTEEDAMKKDEEIEESGDILDADSEDNPIDYTPARSADEGDAEAEGVVEDDGDNPAAPEDENEAYAEMAIDAAETVNGALEQRLREVEQGTDISDEEFDDEANEAVVKAEDEIDTEEQVVSEEQESM